MDTHDYYGERSLRLLMRSLARVLDSAGHAEVLTPLHRHQVALLAQWRSGRAQGDAVDAELLPQLLLSVNAIAAGLRVTG